MYAWIGLITRVLNVQGKLPRESVGRSVVIGCITDDWNVCAPLVKTPSTFTMDEWKELLKDKMVLCEI